MRCKAEPPPPGPWRSTRKGHAQRHSTAGRSAAVFCADLQWPGGRHALGRWGGGRGSAPGTEAPGQVCKSLESPPPNARVRSSSKKARGMRSIADE